MANDGPIPMDLLEAGDPSFVDAIRAVTNAGALADFAATWFDDKRPASRHLLFAYLDRPLNAFRHEGLIKRLFKRAEAEGDDPLMARFLVLFDRSTRRERRTRSCRKHQEVLSHPRGTTMPRGRMVEVWHHKLMRQISIPEWAARTHYYRDLRFQQVNEGEWDALLETLDFSAFQEKLKNLRLFTVATRNYLKRRAWRYFRTLGKTHPDRYVAAAAEALTLYCDDDTADGLALIDNWGLIHLLFHHCPALEALPSGWTTRADRSLAELAPSPIYEPLWDQSPDAAVGLLATARSRAVRRWAIRRVEADPDRHRPSLPLDGWLDLLGHDDPEVVALAAEVLDTIEGLETLDVDRWIGLAESTDSSAIEALAGMIARHVGADQVTIAQAARLASLRPLPIARLGFSWLREKAVEAGDLRAVLGLVDAPCEPIRPEILGWLRGVLAASGDFTPSMVLEFLDSRHADVRVVGWDWFRADPRAVDDVETWRKLLESPHDDVRLAMVTELEAKVRRGLDPEALRLLWATVLLNVHRGARAKPGVVRQVLRRLQASPAEASELLPMLGLALRSVRGPERRAGLVAVVRLVEGRPEVGPLVRSSFPELQMT